MIKLPKLAILEQEMDRKDFVKNVGVGLLLLLGGSMIINALTGLDRGSKKSPSGSQGYGSSSYGGK